MGRIPFHWSLDHSVVAPPSCWANKHVPQRLRGTARHAKNFNTNSVTTSKMLCSQHSSLELQTVIIAQFSLVFLGKMGCGPFRWALNNYVVPPVGCCANKHVPEGLSGSSTCKQFQGQQCDHFRHVDLKTLILRASNCHFCPVFTCFLHKNGLSAEH